jgi:hypothetical protein
MEFLKTFGIVVGLMAYFSLTSMTFLGFLAIVISLMLSFSVGLLLGLIGVFLLLCAEIAVLVYAIVKSLSL